MMAIAISVLGATLSVASPNTSYVHSAAKQEQHVQTTASAERGGPETRVLSLNGRGQYVRPCTATVNAAAPTTKDSRTFLSGGK